MRKRTTLRAVITTLAVIGFALAGGTGIAQASTAGKGTTDRSSLSVPDIRTARLGNGLTVHYHVSRVLPRRLPDVHFPVPARIGRGSKPALSDTACSTTRYESYTSTCWSGYLLDNTPSNSVGAMWTVPAVQTECATCVYADGTWVGIGGTDGGLLQAGTVETSYDGTPAYYAFEENLPGQSSAVPLFEVYPGDVMDTSVSLTSGSTWSVFVFDTTTGLGDMLSETYTGSTDSAEFIQEAPSDQYNDVLPMDPYQEFSFYNMSLNGGSPGLDSYEQVTMPTLSTPSNPSPAGGGPAFNMEYGGGTPDPPGGYETAYQAAGDILQSAGTAGSSSWTTVVPGTSPSITAVSIGNEIAFEGSNGDLWTAGAYDGPQADWHLGMMPGTSPSITKVPLGFEVAFQANTGDLWTFGSDGTKNWGLGMMPGTSPSITFVPNGYEVAFEANTGNLWTAGTDGTKAWSLGMMPGTSPSIMTSTGGYEVAFEANTSVLWTAQMDTWTSGTYTAKDWQLAMAPFTSPSITTVDVNSPQMAYQGANGDLWIAGTNAGGDSGLKMMAWTSPSIITVGENYEVAYRADTGDLYTLGADGSSNWGVTSQFGASPSISEANYS